MKGAVKILVFLSLMQAAYADAAIFMCRDASGRTLTSDRPIPECADRAIREYGNNGAVKRDISAPLTAEQKREKLLQEEKKKAELLAAEEQRKSDRALVSRYRSEDDIAQARKRDTSVVSEQIAQQKKALSNADKEWKETQAAIEAQKKRGPVPAGLQYKLERAEQGARDLKLRLHESEVELMRVDAKYDLTLLRYREISRTVSSR